LAKECRSFQRAFRTDESLTTEPLEKFLNN
jgi:hypothetical protein